jgi:UDPglucose 6-dehydrogenase
MNVLIWGLGYVGTITGACLADRGNFVTGIDLIQEKITHIKSGKTLIFDAGLDRLIDRVVHSGHFEEYTILPKTL